MKKCKKICISILHYLIPIIGIVLNCFAFFIEPFKDEKYIEVIKKLKSSPISSITINNITVGKNIINLERLDSNYDYEYLLLNNNIDNHPCGLDENGNFLFLPNDIECPINYIEFNEKENIDDLAFNYTTIKINNINNKLYLHYSNNNIYGHLYNNISIFIDSINYKLYHTLASTYNIYSNSTFDHSLWEIFEFKSFLNLEKMTIIFNIITIIILGIWMLSVIVAYKNRNIYIFTYFFILIGIIIEFIYYYGIIKNTFYAKINGSESQDLYRINYNEILLLYFILMFAIIHFIKYFPPSYYLMLVYLFDYSAILEENKNIKYSKKRIKEAIVQKPFILNEIEEKKLELEPLINKENELDAKLEEIKKQLEEKQNANTDMKELNQEINKLNQEIDKYRLYIFTERSYS